MEYLSLTEVANLEGKTWEAINKSVRRGRIKSQKIETGERCGFEYRVPVSELSESAKIKYFAENPQKAELPESKKSDLEVKLDDLSLTQREEAFYWEGVIKSWRSYVGEHTEKSATKEFLRRFNKESDKQVTERTLYRKWERYKEFGVVGLADLRGNRKKTGAKIHDWVWHTFSWWWLDENEPSVSFLYKLMQGWLEEHKPELLPLPSEATFRRATQEIPLPVVKYFRKGEKAFSDECETFIHRDYSKIFSNDVWSSDYHTMDIMVRDDETGEVFRPYFVSWFDIKSRKLLGFRLTRTATTDGVILCFRDCAMKWGLPVSVYLDNGREFLSSSFGGRGRRKTDERADYGTTILERCGVSMTNAKVGNAKAKIVERFHKTMTNQFSKCFLTYVGKGPSFRPNRHNKVLKKEENIPLLSEMKRDLENFLEGFYNNTASEAEGMHGLTPNECYKNNLIEKRTATAEQLRLLLTRSVRLQQFKRDGVFIKVGDEKVYYYESDYVQALLGQQVYVRYDSDDLTKVYLYDEKERYIGECRRALKGGYEGADDVEAMKAVAAHNKKLRRDVQTYLNIKELQDAPEVVEAMRSVSESMRRKNVIDYDAKVIRPVMTERVAKASGDDEEVGIYFERMIENARRKKEGKE
ncbi:Mu transposase C-terminal domain-containing protein [Filifactor villosus]|uniref:Mu transposase C-terminal domain-containing protein n=1 Tax=Filifactor villosus TaxID=29374 RepID=A0ABV9QMM9_9FIRM